MASANVDREMAMAEAALLSLAIIIDWSIIIITKVICVVEEPVDDAARERFDEIDTRDLYAGVSPDEGQPEEILAELFAKHSAPEPEFAEPDRRRWRWSRGRFGFGVALAIAAALVVVAMAVGESFNEAQEGGGASSIVHVCCRFINNTAAVASCAHIYVEQSAIERVPIPDQVVENLGVIAR